MSFVGGPFKHDIFISYSHGDSRGDGRALLKQWSQSFVAQLEAELKEFEQIDKAKFSIFLDESFRPGQGIDPMAPLPDTLKAEVQASAILAILMTPHYLSSKWCQQELRWWIEAESVYEAPLLKRIAVAHVWPTASTDWPESLKDSGGNQQHRGFLFYDMARAETHPQPFGWPVVDDRTTGPFRDNLLDLVGRLVARLRELKKQILETQQCEADLLKRTASGGQLLYLHARDIHARQWDDVNRELQDAGYAVMPLEPEIVTSDPKKNLASQIERVNTISQCDAVLLLGTEDAPVLAADLVTIGRQDRYQAVARSNKLLPCGVLDRAGVLRKKPDWQQKARSLGVDWLDASIPPWTHKISSWLQGSAA